jgi:hypothetical protein
MSGSLWSVKSKLLAKDRAADDYFGDAVSIYSSNALIGASADDGKRLNGGTDVCVYVFSCQSGVFEILSIFVQVLYIIIL